MTVIYPLKFRKTRPVAKHEVSQQAPAVTDQGAALHAAVLDIIGDLQSAALLLTDLGSGLAKGMPANPHDIGNAEIIVSQLRALIRTAARSPRAADQHLSRLLKIHLQKIEEEIACPSA